MESVGIAKEQDVYTIILLETTLLVQPATAVAFANGVMAL
jgi:hypothetical protein